MARPRPRSDRSEAPPAASCGARPARQASALRRAQDVLEHLHRHLLAHLVEKLRRTIADGLGELRMVAAIAVPSPAACPALRPVLVLRSRPRLSSARPSGQDHDACLQTQRCDDLVRCAEQVHRPSDCHDRRVWAARSTRCRSQPTPKTASSEVRCRVEAVRDEKKSAFEFPVFATLETGAQTDELRANGQLFTCQPARLLPMAQR